MSLTHHIATVICHHGGLPQCAEA